MVETNSTSFETLAYQANAVNWVAAACMTTLLYNHLITIDQEILRIWKRGKLSLAKCLFFVNRYVVEAMLVFNCISASQDYRSPKFCVFYLRWLTVVVTVSSAAAQAILVLRIFALYRNNRTVLAIAFFFYLGGTITLIGLVIHDYVGELVIINEDLKILPGCYPSSVPSIIAGTWIAPLIVESVLFVIVLSRAWVWWREGAGVPRILAMLTRDSTVYFGVVFAMLLANYLVFELGPPFLTSLLVTPCSTAGCILGSHMFLNLRSMISADDDDFSNGSPGTRRNHSKMVILPIPLSHQNYRRQRDLSDPTQTQSPAATVVMFERTTHTQVDEQDPDSASSIGGGVPGISRSRSERAQERPKVRRTTSDPTQAAVARGDVISEHLALGELSPTSPSLGGIGVTTSVTTIVGEGDDDDTRRPGVMFGLGVKGGSTPSRRFPTIID